MSDEDVSQKEPSIGYNAYSRVNLIHAEARIQICEWCD